ncbi:MAG: CopG family transcriptional regulator [Eubacterium sp.]|nr:CopG family transcriptional regulator [Eubacterium sp.]
MEKLIITPKEDKTVTMTIRIDKSLQEAYNNLSLKTNRSRNELICMALQYALDNMDVKDKE